MNTTRIRIPLAVPDLSGREEEYVVKALRSGWISAHGEFVARFEREFAAAIGVRHAVAVCNGTASLHLALLAMGIGATNEVLVPSLSFISTANAVRYVGATPVFVDIDRATWCLDPEDAAAKITDRTRAIVPVHLYGHPAPMTQLMQMAERRDLLVVEDAAQAFGAAVGGKPVGSFGDAACFSFYGNKIITSGEGGCVATDDDTLAERLRLFRGQGMDPSRRYFFPVVGHNFRPTNIGCAILCAQLERHDSMAAERARVAAAYAEGLRGIPGIELQPIAAEVTPATWLVSVTIEAVRFGCDRDALIAALSEQGIETRPFFIPIHRLPPYLGTDGRPAGTLPVTDDIAPRGINLPTHVGLSDSEVESVCAAIRAVQRSAGR